MQNKDNKVPFADLSAEELQKKAVELQELDAHLQEKEKQLKLTEEALKTKSESLSDLEKDLNKREKQVSKKEATPKSSKPEPGIEFEFDGGDYQFTDEAPKIISINGKGYTQEEIAADENLALSLIGGNSGLILKK